MRKVFVALLLLGVGAGFVPMVHAATDGVEADLGVVRAVVRAPGASGSVFGTANSNCPQATCDTVWVGHSNAGPGGAFLGVGVGGVWNFDTGIAGTDSSQGWRRWAHYYASGGTRPFTTRPEWAVDAGNQINEGNTNLWTARTTAGRAFVKQGIAGAWHSDTMVGVKLNVSNGAEPSATPIAGTRSAWCGLREQGNTTAVDQLTGNFINGNLALQQGGVGTEPEFPGFCSMWDQLLYKDFPAAGSGSISFSIRTDVSNFVDPLAGGTGWFNPDPTNLANLVNNPADSVMVYVGSPKEGAFDTNRRWFSEVLNFANPVQELFAVSGVFPFVAADTALTRAYSGITPVGGNIRVVFRVKTNRVRADNVVGALTAYNSKQGAALVDQVSVNGGTVYGFETVNSVNARSLIDVSGGIAQDGGAWATTGRPPSVFFHIENIAALLYEDLCGAVGAPTRTCDLAGNVLVAGNKDNSNLLEIEAYQAYESPTIDLAVRTAAPGTKNAQGIDKETASRTAAQLDFDIYSGFMGLGESIFYRYAARAYAPAVYKQAVSQTPVWSQRLVYPFIIFNPDPFCYRDFQAFGSLGAPVGQCDSLRAVLETISQGWRFGGTNLGNTRGTYFDRIRVGFIRGGEQPPLSQEIWNKYQDQFPVNEGVSPGDNASFDTTTAYVRTGLNIVAPATDVGVVSGDSILANSPFVGTSANGVRMDLIWRIDWGPGNFVTKGNRATAIVNKDAGHPFAASYLANNGPFGTPGGHGGVWNRNVWNSTRMDSSDVNLWPIEARGIGNPLSPVWSGTLHESESGVGGLRANLGISHPLCYLVDPNGAVDETNIDCSGAVPSWAAAAGAVSGSTTENTKILPDGWFSPGTHVEYFVRRSRLDGSEAVGLLFDTTNVFTQDPSGNPDFDADRWSSFDVLPDMWKSTRYLGAGLACLLMVDDNDRRGAERAYMGAADTTGYGKNNGAKKGWKRGFNNPGQTNNGDPMDANNPAFQVPANLGQAGLNFDLYEVRASESAEAGHPGVRLATNPAGIALKGDKSGPSAAQLGVLYTNVLWFSGDLNSATLHDAEDSQESADDISLLDGYLAGASGANRRGVWLSGDGLMQDAFNNSVSANLYVFLTGTMGADFVSDIWKAWSGAALPQVTRFMPAQAWNHAGRTYGFNHACTILADVLDVVPTVAGAAVAANYDPTYGPAPRTASVFRPLDPGTREYRTLFDGFDLTNLRSGNYTNSTDVQTSPSSSLARGYWLDDVLSGHFQICARRGPIVGVGDLPGTGPNVFANRNLGAFPNPAFAGRNVSLRFTLAQAREIKIRIYNVAGREVANFAHKGTVGDNTVLWDGTLSSGAKASAGVYFYRAEGIEFVKDSAPTKMILLSDAR